MLNINFASEEARTLAKFPPLVNLNSCPPIERGRRP
jgi:hypothetical protein